jgi:hypothetical protein
VTENKVKNSTNSTARRSFLFLIQGKKFGANMSDIMSKNVANFMDSKDEAKDIAAPPINGTKAVEESGWLPLMQVRI